MVPLWRAKLELQLCRLVMAQLPDPTCRVALILYKNALTDYRIAKRRAAQKQAEQHGTPRPVTPRVDSPYLDAREAAAYLGISYSTFRKKRKFIRRMPATGKFRREDLDHFAETLKPRRQK